MGISIIGGGGSGGGGTVQGTDGTYDIRASEEGSTAGNARGENSVDLGTLRYEAAGVASGAGSTISGGEYNKASDSLATVCGGQFNTASGRESIVAGGTSNNATGRKAGIFCGTSNDNAGPSAGVLAGENNDITSGGSLSGILCGKDNQIAGYATAIITGRWGDTISGATYATIITGQYARANIPASVIQGCMADVQANGISSTVTSVLYASTTDATQTEVLIGKPSSRFNLEAGDVYAGHVEVLAKRDNGDWAHWRKINFVISRAASGNVVLVGGVSFQAPDTYGNGLGINNGSGNTWDLDIDADTSNQSLRIRFTGAASENIRVCGSIKALRVQN